MLFRTRLQSHGLSVCSIVFTVACLLAIPARAAFISEIDLASPAGQLIELNDVDPGMDHTLLILDANPFSAFSFGRVLDVIHLPAGSGFAGLATVSDTAWPGGAIATLPLSTLSPASGASTLNLNFTRLLVVMEGLSDARLSDRPTADGAAASRYDASAVTDWLVIGDSPNASWYGSAFDLLSINTTLGISLPDRIADQSDGQVIARPRELGQPIDLNVLVVGDPGPTGAFDVGEGFSYLYTPGSTNLPLVYTVPEPGALIAWLLAGLCFARRRRAGS